MNQGLDFYTKMHTKLPMKWGDLFMSGSAVERFNLITFKTWSKHCSTSIHTHQHTLNQHALTLQLISLHPNLLKGRDLHILAGQCNVNPGRWSYYIYTVHFPPSLWELTSYLFKCWFYTHTHTHVQGSITEAITFYIYSTQKVNPSPNLIEILKGPVERWYISIWYDWLLEVC